MPTELTPMMQQYLEIKKQYTDSILFYRMGDFYEMFFDDAVLAAPILEVQLTSRDKNAAQPTPMCGIPHHAALQYAQKLLERGHKVAICEQMEQPGVGVRGIIRRAVTRVLTPSLIPDSDWAPSDSSQSLACIGIEPTGKFDLAIYDMLSGSIKYGVIDSLKEVSEYLLTTFPKEILTQDFVKSHSYFTQLQRSLGVVSVTIRNEYFVKTNPKPALDALYKYVQETQCTQKLDFLDRLLPLKQSCSLKIDATTAASLELTKSLSQTQGLDSTVYNVLNECVTSMGRRLLKEWLHYPSSDLMTINGRFEWVEEYLEKVHTTQRLRELLRGIRDLERLTTKCMMRLSNPRDLASIRDLLQILPELKQTLAQSRFELGKKTAGQLHELDDLKTLLTSALEDNPPLTLKEGGVIRASFNSEIAELRGLLFDTKNEILKMEQHERENSKISNLKIKYSKVFGYTFEVTKSHLEKVPPHFIRKQTIAQGERFITLALKEFEEKLIHAEEKLQRLEEKEFYLLRDKVMGFGSQLHSNARLLAETDVLLNFAFIARENGWVRPRLHDGFDLKIEDGRHPVVEKLVAKGKFVPNSMNLDEGGRTLIITGPNMGGKSTAMRQTAIIVILAHMGCFVPAKKAEIPITDAIYTRIGSSDDVGRGLSTFMVEMEEVARILRNATSKSLILIDEIGRGTSTYDGLSLAWSILEYLHESIRAKVLFATHFHELTQLQEKRSGIRNMCVLVELWNNDIVFLHRLVDGASSKSYGVEVAKLAGLPREVLERAGEVLVSLEQKTLRSRRAENLKDVTEQLQQPLFI